MASKKYRTKRILQMAEIFMKVNGFFLEKRPCVAIFNAARGLSLSISFLILCIIGIVVDSEKPGQEGLPLTVKIISSVIAFVCNENQWRQLIYNLSELDLYEKLDEDERGEMNGVIKFYINFSILYSAQNILAIVFFYLKSLYTFELPLLIYTPCNLDHLHCKLPFLFYEMIIDYLMIPFPLGFSLLFIYIVLSIVCQLEAVKCLIRKADVNTRQDEFNIIIKEHNRALELVDDFRNIAQSMFLIIYMTSTFTVCAAFYMVNRKGFPPLYDDVAKYTPILSIFMLEFFIYAYGATKLSDVIGSVGDEAYGSKWPDIPDSDLRKSLLFLIEKSQTTKRLTIGGMKVLDLPVFVVVMQNAFSFYTLMMNLGDE